MNGAAGAGGALAGLVVSQAGYGWLSALAAALLLPVAVLLVLDHSRRGGGRPARGQVTADTARK